MKWQAIAYSDGPLGGVVSKVPRIRQWARIRVMWGIVTARPEWIDSDGWLWVEPNGQIVEDNPTHWKLATPNQKRAAIKARKLSI